MYLDIGAGRFFTLIAANCFLGSFLRFCFFSLAIFLFLMSIPISKRFSSRGHPTRVQRRPGVMLTKSDEFFSQNFFFVQNILVMIENGSAVTSQAGCFL
jgi:hypothetical protein